VFRYLICGVLLVLSSVCFAYGQTAADSLFKIARTAYDNGEFDISELAALRGMRANPGMDELDLMKFHLLLGYIYVARDQRDASLQEFNSVLMANPKFEVDPVQTAPKIVDVFREAKRQYIDRMLNQPAVYRMPQADARLAASWRSVLLPGWGQLYKKQEVKGVVLASAQVLALVALVATQIDVNHHHNIYLDKKVYGDPTIEGAYSEYRRAYQMRNSVGYVTLGIYLINYLDALYYPVLKKK
jgi:hypothetical protein